MSNTVSRIITAQREYFSTGATLPIKTRLQYLKSLKSAIISRKPDICAALKADLNKSASEAYMVEIGMVLEELSYTLKHLKRWAKPKRARSPLAQFPAKSFVLSAPYGVTLVISPWNYPFLLSMQPVVGAIAAGNTVILKPSRASAHTSSVMKEIIESVFPETLAACLHDCDGAAEGLLEHKFDYILFTGGAEVGKQVYAAASKTLTPVTLELGGKSPVVVDQTAKLELVAKRIVFGKLLNAGQTCIAPDYVIAHKSIADKLVECLKKYIVKLYSANPLECEYYGKMINSRHYERVKGLIDDTAVYGGKFDDAARKIEPTILYPATLDAPAMQQEIFGPVLPVLTYSDKSELYDIIGAHPTPLAFYLFTENKKTEKELLSKIMFGGGCVNDTIMHIATSRMPFGGVGASGIGSYHGEASFNTFSHKKSVLKKSTVLDLPIRYTPYSHAKDKLVEFFLR